MFVYVPFASCMLKGTPHMMRDWWPIGLIKLTWLHLDSSPTGTRGGGATGRQAVGAGALPAAPLSFFACRPCLGLWYIGLYSRPLVAPSPFRHLLLLPSMLAEGLSRENSPSWSQVDGRGGCHRWYCCMLQSDIPRSRSGVGLGRNCSTPPDNTISHHTPRALWSWINTAGRKYWYFESGG
ncbi:hypothetical protein LX36DRAFT_445282 [Colletotrichum falcatum]|nr:hypothetical protein LX36DRAFT_445282 [Colletotrichum falcatum]